MYRSRATLTRDGPGPVSSGSFTRTSSALRSSASFFALMRGRAVRKLRPLSRCRGRFDSAAPAAAASPEQRKPYAPRYRYSITGYRKSACQCGCSRREKEKSPASNSTHVSRRQGRVYRRCPERERFSHLRELRYDKKKKKKVETPVLVQRMCEEERRNRAGCARLARGWGRGV